MQNSSLENKFSKIIAKKNSGSYIKNKISLVYFLLVITGMILGIVIFSLMYSEKNYTNEWIIHHLENVKSHVLSLEEFISFILDFSKSDIRILILVFISGFTYFCFPVAGMFIFLKSFIAGFSFLYFYECVRIKEWTFSQNNALSLLAIFILFKIVICLIEARIAVSAHIFSYKFKEIKSNSSILRRAPITYKYVSSLIFSAGGVLFLNMCYCYLVSKIIK